MRILAFIFALFASVAAYGSTFELAANVNGTVDWSGRRIDSASRRGTAQTFVAYWQSFSDRLPRLSPAEDEWLKEEMDGGTERLSGVLNRREGALWSLAITADACLDIYSRLATETGNNRNYEAYLWIKSLNCYRNSSDTVEYLRISGLSNGKYDGPFYVSFFGHWENYTINKILENVLLYE